LPLLLLQLLLKLLLLITLLLTLPLTLTPLQLKRWAREAWGALGHWSASHGASHLQALQVEW